MPKPHDPFDLLASLPAQEGYTELDRYRDFKKVFMGSEEGQRVLRELLSWGRMFRAPILGKPVDPYAMAISLGERNIALKLLATVHTEPTDKPQRAKQKPTP